MTSFPMIHVIGLFNSAVHSFQLNKCRRATIYRLNFPTVHTSFRPKPIKAISMEVECNW